MQPSVQCKIARRLYSYHDQRAVLAHGCGCMRVLACPRFFGHGDARAVAEKQSRKGRPRTMMAGQARLAPRRGGEWRAKSARAFHWTATAGAIARRSSGHVGSAIGLLFQRRPPPLHGFRHFLEPRLFSDPSFTPLPPLLHTSPPLTVASPTLRSRQPHPPRNNDSDQRKHRPGPQAQRAFLFHRPSGASAVLTIVQGNTFLFTSESVGEGHPDKIA